MRKLLLIIGMIVTIFSCQQSNKAANVSNDPNVHKGIALEKINTSQYTYLLVDENGVQNWLAFPLAEVKIGETYYYVNEMLMSNFVSKELGKTFDKVYFIQGVYTEPPTKVANANSGTANPVPAIQSNPQPMPQGATEAPIQANTSMHKVVALEKINTRKYTYLRVNESGLENWIAFPLSDVKIGETDYYTNEMLMSNFESKELKRTFEKVYFVPGVTINPTSQPAVASNVDAQSKAAPHQGNSKVTSGKIDTKVEPAKNGLTIANLISKKESYAGKKVLVKGKVTKFSAEIMGRNWIHIQDGTEHNGNFDLTITSQSTVNIGDIVTFEGIITLNKDFGAGYKYDMIMEDASIK